MPLGWNRILGDCKLPEAARPHRVGIANWPTSIQDRRTATLDALLNHLRASGYEGVEFGPSYYTKFFPGDSVAVSISKANAALAKVGLKHFGSTLHVSDEVMRKLNWTRSYAEQIKQIVDMGGQYASYQIGIAGDYAQSGGMYREDESYLRWCAEQVRTLREMTWEAGLNFYNEVHVDRITEDPAALCRLLDLCPCELNGDMSHYLARGFVRGPQVERILKHVQHSHVRMARQYGDLSVVVEDPAADWGNKGVTWQMFQYMTTALKGGFTSRCIVGETGPMHLVKDTLTQDAALVPLYRAMARYADASAQGINIKVSDPSDLKPWG